MGSAGKRRIGTRNYEREIRCVFILHVEIMAGISESGGYVFALPVGSKGEFVAGTVNLTDGGQHCHCG